MGKEENMRGKKLDGWIMRRGKKYKKEINSQRVDSQKQ